MVLPSRVPSRCPSTRWPFCPWPVLLAPTRLSWALCGRVRSASLVCVISTLAFSSFPGTGIALPSRLCWIWAWGLLAAWRCCVTWHRKEYIVIDFQAACQCVGFGKRTFLCCFTEDREFAVDFSVVLEKARCRAHVGASWLRNCPLALSRPLSLPMSPLWVPVRALGPCPCLRPGSRPHPSRSVPRA